jgi:hypothetical protein
MAPPSPEFAAFYANQSPASLWKSRLKSEGWTNLPPAYMSGGYLPYVLPALYTEIIAEIPRMETDVTVSLPKSLTG